MQRISLSQLQTNNGQIPEVPANPRTINKDDYAKLLKSLEEDPEFLEHKPLHVYPLDKKYIVLGGNMRLRALKELGHKDVPVTIYKPETPPEVLRSRVMKDNAEYGKWDFDLIANEWSDDPIGDWGIDLPDDWMQEEPKVEEDEAPEVSDEPAKSKLGELYQLGRHRVMCGSSIEEDVVDKLFGATKIDLYLTDPPYNVNYTGKTKDALKIDNDSMDDLEFQAFLTDANRRADEHMKEGAAFYIFHADSEGYNFRASVKEVGWMLKQCLIWVKQSMVMGRQDYQWQHEPILYGWKSGASHSWYSDRKQTTVLNFDRPSRSTEHPTMKPINILAYLISNSSKAGDIVYDAFSGSGSGLIACEQTDRTFYGCEVDPRFVDVIRKRYAKFVQPDNELPENWEELTAPIESKV